MRDLDRFDAPVCRGREGEPHMRCTAGGDVTEDFSLLARRQPSKIDPVDADDSGRVPSLLDRQTGFEGEKR
ncbi:hypothetical protein D3C72_2523130 [compost metagenome]